MSSRSLPFPPGIALLSALVAFGLSAAEAADEVMGLSLPEGVEARVIASHEAHGVTSPTALAYDEQGRLFVTETHRFRHGVEDNRDRQFWLLDDISALTVGDRRAMLEKWSERVTPAYMTEKSEVIRRLDAPGEDGVFANSEVFAKGFDDALDGTAAGVFCYEGVAYFACIPKIYALGISDTGEEAGRKVIEDGFGVRFSYSGHDLNGFALGPDGRIYATIGDRGFHVETSEGETHAYPDQGAVFRFEPDGSNFEVLHTGLRNPKEIAFDEYGNAISVDNNADQGDRARVVQVLDGGDSGWRMGHQVLMSFHREVGLEEGPPTPWMAEQLWELESDAHPAWLLPPVGHITAGPSGLAYHPGGDLFPSESGRFLICDYRGGAAASGVMSFGLEPDGAGLKMVDPRRCVWGLAATDVVFSWDGRMVISDYIGGWTSHEAGRVVEVSDGRRTPEVAEMIATGFRDRKVKELSELLGHADLRVRMRAHLALTSTAEGRAALAELAKSGEDRVRRHAIWGLGVIVRCGAAIYPDGPSDEVGGAERAEVMKLLVSFLGDADAEVRAQVVQALGDAGKAGDEVISLLGDESARVRMFAALALSRSGVTDAAPALISMLAANADRDVYLRHGGIVALQRLMKPVDLVALAEHESIAVRRAAVVALGRQRSDAIVAFLDDSDAGIVAEAVRMISDFSMTNLRPALVAVLKREDEVARSEAVWHRLLHAALRLGNGEGEALLDFALNDARPLRSRREALRLLGQWEAPPLIDGATGRADAAATEGRGRVDAQVRDRARELIAISPELLEAAAGLLAEVDLGDAVPMDDLQARVADESLPGTARRALLGLLPVEASQRAFLAELAEDADGGVALAALERLMDLKVPEAVEAVRRATRSEDVGRRQQAWQLAAELPGAADLFVEALGELAANGGSDAAALEILQAAEKREEGAVKEALASSRAKLAEGGDLGPHRVALQGGDARRGELVFRNHAAAQCLRCHVEGGGHGAGAGPDLSKVGERLSREEILESIITPGAVVTAGYGMVSATLEDGSVVAGTLVAEGEDFLEIDTGGEKRRVSRDELQSVTDPISAMPPMGAILSAAELRDLIAWLSERR